MYEEKILELLGPEPVNAGDWMEMSNPADLQRAAKLVEATYTHRGILALADEGDRLSQSQTKHDRAHLFNVRDVGMPLMAEYDKRFPGRLDEWTKQVVVPLALFLHDIGRAVDVDNHAVAGGRVAHVYLTRLRFPKPVIQRICRIIALHRSSQVLKREFDDPAWAIVVIADKCVGDEDRVRALQATILWGLSLLGLASFNWWADAEHDRINYAIQHAELIVDSDESRGSAAGAIVLKLKLRTSVTSPLEVTSVYGERFHACGRGAQFLGFVFRIEFNGVRYMYDKATKLWRPVPPISVPMP